MADDCAVNFHALVDAIISWHSMIYPTSLLLLVGPFVSGLFDADILKIVLRLSPHHKRYRIFHRPLESLSPPG